MKGYTPVQAADSLPASSTSPPTDEVGAMSPYGNAAAIGAIGSSSTPSWLDAAGEGQATASSAEFDDRGSASIRYPTEEQLEDPPGPVEGGFETADGWRFANPELRRQIEEGNADAAAYAERIASEAAPLAGQPQPFPALLGTPEYYDARHADAEWRHQGDPPPPDYYLDYGRKYCVRFSEELYPQLSPAGQEWCVATRSYLQLAIEDELLDDPERFDELERDSAKFRSFAFSTHPAAYLKGGLADLPVMDLVYISMTPDIGDLLTRDGLAQIGVVLPEVAPEKIRDAIEGGVPFSEDGTMEWLFGSDEEAPSAEASE